MHLLTRIFCKIANQKPFVVLCVLFCSYSIGQSNNGTNGPLSIHVKLEMGNEYEFIKDAPSRLVFTIENKSDDFIIIRAIDVENGLADITRWYGSFYGSTEYKPLEDIWIYNQMSQMLTKTAFATGLIQPGGGYEFPQWAILKDETVDVNIAYQKLTKDEVLKQIYFEINDNNNFTTKRIFKHLKNADILEKETKNINWSFVIAPNASDLPFDKQHLECKLTLREPEFSFEQAKKAVSSETSDCVFWKSQNCWVLKTDKGIYLVDKDKTLLLPEMDLLVFALIESQHQKVTCILPLTGYEKYDAQKPHIEGPGYYNPGITEVPKEKLISLFEYAGARGDKISVLVYNPNGLGKRLYLLVGQFDEKMRRKSVQ